MRLLTIVLLAFYAGISLFGAGLLLSDRDPTQFASGLDLIFIGAFSFFGLVSIWAMFGVMVRGAGRKPVLKSLLALNIAVSLAMLFTFFGVSPASLFSPDNWIMSSLLIGLVVTHVLALTQT